MFCNIEDICGYAFLAYDEMLPLLLSELKSRFKSLPKPKIYGDLVCFFEEKSSLPFSENNLPYWARTTLLEIKKASFNSISDAANILKAQTRNWGSYQFCNFRRAELIQQKLPYLNTKPKQFPFEVPLSPMGIFTLLDEHTMIFSSKTSSCLPTGKIEFIEDHENPPSRAYLKIQEALVRFKMAFPNANIPKNGDKCFEAGACPGGWTWVLRNLDCEIIAVDRSPLADFLMADPKVQFIKHDAFTLTPTEIGKVDWVLSDVICYPERLYEWILKWIESGLCTNMICTIKMQGEIDWNLVQKFSEIPSSKIVHLCYNKHELTFLHCGGTSN